MQIKETVNKYLPVIQQIKAGSVRLLLSQSRLFTQENLAKVFEGTGLEIEQTFLIKKDGHLFFGSDPYKGAQKIGVVIKAPKRKN